MLPQLRFASFLAVLLVACGSTSVRSDPTPDGGGNEHRVRGAGGNAGIVDGGAPAGGRGGSHLVAGGSPGSGGFFGGDGASFGAGGYQGVGGEFAIGGTPGSGGNPGSGGEFPGAGGNAGSGGNPPGTGGGRATDPACCDAIPQCRAGYDQVSGPNECAKGDVCYEATACCSRIWCKAHPDEDAGACAAEAPRGVRYVSANASVCDRRAWTCPPNAYQYWDACGCGCSQDPSCPASVDCKATPDDPLCTDGAACPYTTRTH
jgi:hypothetical protein